MVHLRPGASYLILGIALLAGGGAFSLALAYYGLGFPYVQPTVALYLLLNIITFSGIILTVLGIRRVLFGAGRHRTIDIL
jgi:hypothetical protein